MSHEDEKFKQLWSAIITEGDLLKRLNKISPVGQIDSIVIQSRTFGDIEVYVERANGIGENYMSETLSLTVTQHKEEFKAFCKILPTNSLMREGALEIKCHDNEMGIYSNLFPVLEKTRQDAQLPNDKINLKVPVLYYVEKGKCEDKDGSIIIMEDLKLQGFQPANRSKGCDIHHLQVAMDALADYHALSIAYLQGIRAENKGLLNMPEKLSFIQGLQRTDTTMLNAVKSTIPHYTKYFKEHGYEKLGSWIAEVTQRECDQLFIVPDDPEGLICINHGDFWINNMMFRYEDSIPVDIKIVDWQLPKLGHPGRDVAFFLYSCTTEDTREEHMDQLLKDYFFNLKASLSLLGVDLEEISSWEQFLKAMKKYFLWAMYTSFIFLPLTLDTDFAAHIQVDDPEEEGEETKGDFSSRFIEANNKVIAANGIPIAKDEHFRKRFVDILQETKLKWETS